MRYDVFNKYINEDGPIHQRLGTKCHIWIGIEKNHYGIYNNESSHRIMWKYKMGEIPDGLIVRHKCDNGLCVNIEHLELGTHQDNSNDTIMRGRVRTGAGKGENAGPSKLTRENVIFIRDNKDKYTQKELSEMFDITRNTISRILNGKRWSDVSPQLTREQIFLNKATEGEYNEMLKTYCLEMPTARMLCSYKNKSMLAHRIAWIIEYGEIPDGTFVLHKCDNARCINHLHLELGDHEKNMKDRCERKRTASGTRSGMSKLTEENVRYIRNNPDKKMGIELARQFGVSENCITNIKKYRSYKDVI